MKKPIEELANHPAFRACWEQMGKGGYPYPEGWLDELFVHATAHYLDCKAGLLSEEHARQYRYCSYELAIYDAIFDHYDQCASIDDFIYFAMTHIRADGDGEDAQFVYVRPSADGEETPSTATE